MGEGVGEVRGVGGGGSGRVRGVGGGGSGRVSGREEGNQWRHRSLLLCPIARRGEWVEGKRDFWMLDVLSYMSYRTE